jgi:hypothetical protein
LLVVFPFGACTCRVENELALHRDGGSAADGGADGSAAGDGGDRDAGGDDAGSPADAGPSDGGPADGGCCEPGPFPDGGGSDAGSFLDDGGCRDYAFDQAGTSAVPMYFKSGALGPVAFHGPAFRAGGGLPGTFAVVDQGRLWIFGTGSSGVFYLADFPAAPEQLSAAAGHETQSEPCAGLLGFSPDAGWSLFRSSCGYGSTAQTSLPGAGITGGLGWGSDGGPSGSYAVVRGNTVGVYSELPGLGASHNWSGPVFKTPFVESVDSAAGSRWFVVDPVNVPHAFDSAWIDHTSTGVGTGLLVQTGDRSITLFRVGFSLGQYEVCATPLDPGNAHSTDGGSSCLFAGSLPHGLQTANVGGGAFVRAAWITGDGLPQLAEWDISGEKWVGTPKGLCGGPVEFIAPVDVGFALTVQHGWLSIRDAPSFP